MSSSLLHLNNVCLSYQNRLVLNNISFRVSSGDVIALIGCNGAGKTSLLKAISGLHPIKGVITINGFSLLDISAEKKAQAIGYIEQNPLCHWPLSVYDLVSLGRLPYRAHSSLHHSFLSTKEREKIIETIDSMDLHALADRPVTTLSGGEYSRAMIARAIAGEPDILLADEPAAMLDPRHRLHLLNQLISLAQKGYKNSFTSPPAVILALHDLSLAALCNRVIILHHGSIYQDSSPKEALCSEILSSVFKINFLTGKHQGRPWVVPWST